MAMTVFIQLTSAGADTGPFNLYENYSGWVLLAAGVSKQDLLDGITYTTVNNGTTQIRIESTGACENYVDVELSTTTSTSTTSGEAPVADRTTYIVTVDSPPCGWTYPRYFEIIGMNPAEICTNYFYSSGYDPTTIDYVEITTLTPDTGVTITQGTTPLNVNDELTVNSTTGEYDDGNVFIYVDSEVVSGISNIIKFQVVFTDNTIPSAELELRVMLDACQEEQVCNFYLLVCEDPAQYTVFGYTECGGQYKTIKVYYFPIATPVCAVGDVTYISGGAYTKTLLGDCSPSSSTTSTSTTTGVVGDCYTLTIPYADLQDAGENLYVIYTPPTLNYAIASPYYTFTDYGSTDWTTYLCSVDPISYQYGVAGEQALMPAEWFSNGCSGCCSENIDCILT